MDRADFADYLPAVMIEHPALGGTLRAGEAVTLLLGGGAADAILTLTAFDGTLLWSALATPDEPAYLPYGGRGEPGRSGRLGHPAGGGPRGRRRRPGHERRSRSWLEPSARRPPTTTLVPVAPADDAPTVVVYFLDADTGAAVPVARDLSVLNVRPLPDLGPLTVELLLSGPGAWGAAPLDEPVAAAEARLTTRHPRGDDLLSFSLVDGTATVDLSAEFLSGDPATRNARFAQLVFTLTRLEGVQEVRVLVAGSPASPLDGEPGPLTWQDVDGLVPPAVIAYPPLGGTLSPAGHHRRRRLRPAGSHPDRR